MMADHPRKNYKQTDSNAESIESRRIDTKPPRNEQSYHRPILSTTKVYRIKIFHGIARERIAVPDFVPRRSQFFAC